MELNRCVRQLPQCWRVLLFRPQGKKTDRATKRGHLAVLSKCKVVQSLHSHCRVGMTEHLQVTAKRGATLTIAWRAVANRRDARTCWSLIDGLCSNGWASPPVFRVSSRMEGFYDELRLSCRKL